MNSEKQALVPRLRFPEFRDAGEWEAQKIGHHLTESRVKGSKGDVAKKLTVKLWGNGVYEKSEAVQGSANTQYYRRIAGQFIYSKLDFLNQAFGIIPDHLDSYESTVDLPCFDASDELDVRFLLEYVQRKSFYKKYGEIADGGRKAKRIQVETFLDFPLFLPTLREQQKIADCLSSLDALIAAQADKIDALKTHKKGLMQQLFPREGETAPRLRFPEFRDAGEWEPKFLGAICDNISSGKDKSDSEGLYDLYGSTEIIGKTASDSYSGVYILVARVGANAGALTKSEGTFGVTDNTLVLHLKDLEMINFVYFWLDRVGLNKLVFGSGQPLVTGKQLKELELCFPSHKEQEEIVNCFLSLDELIVAHTEKLDALKTHKKGLMQRLFPIVEGLAQ